MNREYIDIAFEEAYKAFAIDEVPIGAVIVKDNKIIAKAHNLKETLNCCTKHAEIIAIEYASKKLNNWRLIDCDLYVTLDPCPMCASAIKQARIKNVYSAGANSDLDNYNIISNIFNSNDINPSINFISNVDTIKSKNILNDFFNKKRNN